MCHLCNTISSLSNSTSIPPSLSQPISKLLQKLHSNISPHLGDIWLWRLNRTLELRSLILKMSKQRLASNTSKASNASNKSSTSQQISGSERSGFQSTTKSQFFSPLKKMLEEVDKEIQHIKINMYAHPPRRSTGKLHSLNMDIYPSESPSGVGNGSLSRWKEEELTRERDGEVVSVESRAGARNVSPSSRGMSDKQKDPKVRFVLPSRKGSPLHPSLPVQSTSIARVSAWLTQCNHAIEGQDQEADQEEEREVENMSVVSLDGIDYERPKMDVKLWTRVKEILASSFSLLGRSSFSRNGIKGSETTFGACEAINDGSINDGGGSQIGQYRQYPRESTTTNTLSFIDEKLKSKSKAVLTWEGAAGNNDFMPRPSPLPGKARTTIGPQTTCNKGRSGALEAIRNLACRHTQTVTNSPATQTPVWVAEDYLSHTVVTNSMGGTRKEPRHAHVIDSYQSDQAFDNTYYDDGDSSSGSSLSSRCSEINMGSIIGKSKGKSETSGQHQHRPSPERRRPPASSRATPVANEHTAKIFAHLEKNERRRLSDDFFVPAAPEPLPLERPYKNRNRHELSESDDDFIPVAPEPLPLKGDSKRYNSRVERQRILDEAKTMPASRYSGERGRDETKTQADQSNTEKSTNKSPRSDRKRYDVLDEGERGPSENVSRRRVERAYEGKRRDYNITERTKYWGQ